MPRRVRFVILAVPPMKPQFKLGLYLVTVVGTFLFGFLLLRSWRDAGERGSRAVPSSGVASVASAHPSVDGTGGGAAGTSSAAESGGGGTNAGPTGAVGVAGEGVRTNLGTTVAEVSPELEGVPMRRPGNATRGLGRMITWALLAVASLAGLGVLVAYDLSHYAANRAALALFNDRGEDATAGEYELIEKAYGDGDYLEAVRMLRAFLGSNPRAVHAQIRIAEIYEKDLANPLAAALEYEEVMKQPLDPERRGWTGIHLVNLYNRLEKPGQAVALMRRICVECPDTPAAGKARERLEAMGEAVPERPMPGAGGAAGDPGLPPGFRKKR